MTHVVEQHSPLSDSEDHFPISELAAQRTTDSSQALTGQMAQTVGSQLTDSLQMYCLKAQYTQKSDACRQYQFYDHHAKTVYMQ